MKVLYPRNIPKGMFNMHLTLGPLTITIVQMFILAAGAAVALAVFNGVTRTGSGNKAVGVLATVPVILLFVFIAFFKISEMGLLEFIAKFMRTYFFDAPKKFQTNYPRLSPYKISIAKIKATMQKKKVEQKEFTLDKEQLDKLQNSGLI